MSVFLALRTGMLAVGLGLSGCAGGKPTGLRPAPVGDAMSGVLFSSSGQLMFRPDDAPADDTEPPPALGESGAVMVQPTGVFSTVLPLGGNRAVAVRTDHFAIPPYGRDALVLIDGGTLQQTRLWAPGQRLLLVGLAGRQAVVLAFDGTAARLVAVDVDDGRRVASDPVPVELSEFGFSPRRLYNDHFTEPLDAHPPLSAPDGAGVWLLPCGVAICRARVGQDAVTVELTARSADSVPWAPGLAVDGQATLGAELVTSRARVSPVLVLPAFSGQQAARSCTISRARPADGQGGVTEVLVPAGCSVSFGFDDWALALPAERVSIAPLRARGLYRVELPPPQSEAFDWGDCRQGRLWLRTTAAGGEPTLRAWDWEYGYCD